LAHPGAWARAALATLLAGGLAGALALSAQGAFHLKLASRASNGAAANGDSTTEAAGSSISHDGSRVSFVSKAANLPHGDGTTYRAYVRDLATGKTRLVSTDSNGHVATGEVFGASISAGGRFVAFFGKGDGLPGANGFEQVWIRDLKTGKTRLASRAGNGDAGDSNSYYDSVSAGGRFVAFTSTAVNLPGGNGSDNFAYIRDMKKGRTILISRTSGGSPATGRYYGQAVSSDGTLAVFHSSDAGLPGANGYSHVYLRNLPKHRTILLDRAANGQVGNDAGYDPSISSNGRFVAFDSYASHLPAPNPLHHDQVFLRDLSRGKTRFVSRNSAGHAQDGQAYYGHPSEDGRFVVFEAYASNLPGGDGSTTQIYDRDLRKGRTRILSRAANGDAANAFTDYPSISADGRFASLYSGATNLGGNTSFTNVFRAGAIG
jgi:WD40 repeat protein